MQMGRGATFSQNKYDAALMKGHKYNSR
ncbi:hypothetical protein CLUP02_12866 [Colletotrichum lupini]|uniref:Uncharacterized protein n=1 Tax=Colletotrichum lupini TaxID=145971 RepID=A0A9Q8T321_9PEZI|nr:hypothetical protein CLUP02_12866 [Colletotrichum lupini]